MIELSFSIATLLASFGLFARTAAVGRQIEASLAKVKEAVVQEINYSLLTPAEREKLGIPAPAVKIEEPQSPDGRAVWDVPSCGNDHSWSAMWLEKPRRVANQKHSYEGDDGKVYVRICQDCGQRNVKGPLTEDRKNFVWYLD